MKLQTSRETSAIVLGGPGILVSLGALSCLSVVLVIMGIKLLGFRRQMRLGRFAQVTAANSARLEMAAYSTNVPSQGVFRSWSQTDEGTPPAPPPPVVKPRAKAKSQPPPRPKSAPVPKPSAPERIMSEPGPSSSTKKKSTAPEEPKPPEQPQASTSKKTPAATQNAIPLPSKGVKSKGAPPTRKNPNAPSFAMTSAISQPSTFTNKPSAPKPKISAPKSPTSPQPPIHNFEPTDATNPILVANSASKIVRNDSDRKTESNNFPMANGHVEMPAKPSTNQPKSRPKMRPKSAGKKTSIKKEHPAAVKATATRASSPPKGITSIEDDFENTGNLSFRMPGAVEPFEVHPSFLEGVVGDSDECDA